MTSAQSSFKEMQIYVSVKKKSGDKWMIAFVNFLLKEFSIQLIPSTLRIMTYHNKLGPPIQTS